jgi:hypothetical protein
VCTWGGGAASASAWRRAFSAGGCLVVSSQRPLGQNAAKGRLGQPWGRRERDRTSPCAHRTRPSGCGGRGLRARARGGEGVGDELDDPRSSSSPTTKTPPRAAGAWRPAGGGLRVRARGRGAARQAGPGLGRSRLGSASADAVGARAVPVFSCCFRVRHARAAKRTAGGGEELVVHRESYTRCVPAQEGRDLFCLLFSISVSVFAFWGGRREGGKEEEAERGERAPLLAPQKGDASLPTASSKLHAQNRTGAPIDRPTQIGQPH